MAKSEKTYNVSAFMGKVGKVKSKFTSDAVANAEGRLQLPAGSYTVQLGQMTMRETKNNDPCILIPYIVTEGEFANRKGSILIVVDPKRCVKEGELKGTPMGLFDISKNAKGMGVPTKDEDGNNREMDEVLTDMEEVTTGEPLCTLVVSSRTYDKKDKAGKVLKDGAGNVVTAVAFDETLSGLAEATESAEGETEEETAEEAEEETQEEEAAEEEEAAPSFEVGDEVKYLVGRKQLKGKVAKVNQDGTYNITGQDKKLVRGMTEDKLTPA